MKRKEKNDSELLDKKKTPQSNPKNKTGVPASASQIWRDRLNKIKRSSQGKGPAGALLGNIPATNMRNPFQNTTPGSTARKAKKGFRPQ